MAFGLGIHFLGFSSWATRAPGWLRLSPVGGVRGVGGVSRRKEKVISKKLRKKLHLRK